MTDRIAFEIRESGGSLHGVIVTEGRAASGGRREVFAPGSVTWPAEGVAILAEHYGATEARAFPHRMEGGEIRIRAKATDAIKAAIGAGKKYMSVEFKAIEERTTAGGVREILRAYVPAAALVDDPEYDSTAAEIRNRQGRIRRPWL